MTMDDKAKENWGSAGPYEFYGGRWSRKIAVEFLDWIGVPQKSAWASSITLSTIGRAPLPFSIARKICSSGGAAKVGAFLYHHGTRLAVVAATRDVL